MRGALIRSVVAVVVALTSLITLNTPAAKAEPTWTKIYETVTSQRGGGGTPEISYALGFGKTGGAASAFISSGTSWDLIKIRMEMTRNGGSKYFAEAYFDKWSGATIADLQFPDYGNNLSLKKNVTNLVVTSDYTYNPTDLRGVKTGSYASGRIEFWPYNYSPGNTGLAPFGNDGLYDFDDRPDICGNCYGSYQVHNLTEAQTIMAWNQHAASTQDLGLGSQPSSHPDWTFAGAAEWNNTGFKVQVFVGTAVSASTINAPTVGGAQQKGKATTLTATTNVAGKVTFYFGTKRIPGCIGRLTTNVSGTQTATCTFKPPTSGQLRYSARLAPTSGSYTASTSTETTVQIGRRTGPR
jgi:hypothetical protein